MVRSMGFGVAALILISGCGRAANAHLVVPTLDVPKVATVAKPAAPRVDTIVLFGDSASAALDADGEELDAAPAFRIASGSEVLGVKQDLATGSYSCDLDFDGTPFHEDGVFFSKALALMPPSGPELVLVAPEKQETEPNVMVESKMSSSITAVVGPYAFVSVESSIFGCGAAHPFGGTTASIFDVRTGREVELLAPDGAEETATEALKERGFEDKVTLVEARPQFDANGHLSMRWRFEKPSSYAETDGEGHSYTVSSWVDSDVLPPELSALADPPPALASYLKTHPGPITGWSKLD